MGIIMKSCDKLMCSNILEHITYNDMTLFDGISNNLRFFEYANQKIIFQMEEDIFILESYFLQDRNYGEKCQV